MAARNTKAAKLRASTKKFVVVRLIGQPPVVAKPTTPPTATVAVSWYEVGLDPDLIKAGENHIAVELATTRPVDSSVLLDRVELKVSYR